MFKRKIYFNAIYTTIITVALTSPALADPLGINLGVDYGRAEAKKYCDHITNCRNSDNDPKVEVGYDFTQYYGIELGFASFGTIFDAGATSPHMTQESHASTLSLLGTLPITDRISIYGRAGFAHFNTNNTGVIKGIVIKNENGNTPFLGIGLKFNLNEQYSLRVEFQNYANLSDLPGRQDDVQGLFLGVMSHF